MPTATTASLRAAACTGLALLALTTTVAVARADGPGGAAAPGAGADPSGSIAEPVATPVPVPAPDAVTGGASPTEAPASTAAPLPAVTVDGPVARLAAGQGVAPADAPPEVALAVAAANAIVGLPYRWGGGHGSFDDRGYDCSGAVSYVLHAVGVLDDPLDSGSLSRWGEKGRGRWVTVYANGGHAYVVIAGLRFDTSGRGGKGPRWRAASRPSRGFTARHPEGL